MTESVLTTEQLGGVLKITLNRPDKLNGLTRELHLALRAALDHAQATPSVRCVLLTGAGRGFCAGQDLAELRLPPADDATDVGGLVQELFNPLIRQIRNLPIPVIAAVNGVAAGAGANIALACDLTIAGKSANFVQAFIHIALVPDSGGSWLLPQLIGPQRAMALTMLGDKLPAETAAAWGMIYRCVDDADLQAEALKLAQRLAALPSEALAATKRLVHGAATRSLDEQLDEEGREQSLAASAPDYAEGVGAFLQKRPAKFGERKGN